MTEVIRRNLPFIILLAVCFVLASVTASAQTLTVVHPSNHIVSRPLSSIRGGTAAVNGPTEIPNHPLPDEANYRNSANNDEEEDELEAAGGVETGVDTALQTTMGPLIDAIGETHFDGMSVYDGGYIPSDNNIAVGPNHIVETVNAAYAVYSKGGDLLLGPNSLRSLWAGLGGQCAANNGGDPIVQYDLLADRWIITQLGSLSSPYAECIAVSETGDPTGAYNLYSYSFGTNLNDYPKFGVWPTATNSAYLASYNLFAHGNSFAGAEICAYDRAKMIAGDPNPVGLCFTGISGASYLPADLDGATPPLDGTPGYFVDRYSTSGRLGLYKMNLDFSTSSATLSPFSTISVSSFSSAASVPQPGTTRLLDALSDRLMYRLAFRMFGGHESMVTTHSVSTGGVAGVRWYELRAPVSVNGNFSLFQQGTFAPGDGVHRWMGSAAMDTAGNIALGYSASSSSVYPGVRYTGRTPTDPLGTMQSEGIIKDGAGSQTGYSRWGDYSSLRIDPSDDCTFWFANEYLPYTSSYGWYTHIGSFKFTGCDAAPDPDFSLSSSPSSLTLTQGDSGESTVTVTSINGFNGSVDISVLNCPADASCSVSAGSVAPGDTSTVTVTTTSSTTAGPYTLTISGTGSGLTHTTDVSLTVEAAPVPDFSLSANPTSLTLTQGEAGNSAVSVTAINGFSGSVDLSVSGCPTNTTCEVSPTSATPGSGSTLTVTTTSGTPTGPYTLTISGTDSGSSLTHTTDVALMVNEAPVPDFSLSASPTSLTLTQGEAGNSAVSVTGINGFNGSVDLSVLGCPANTSCEVSPTSATPTAGSTLTVTTTGGTPAGNYTLTVSGTDSGSSLTHTTDVALTVDAAVGDFSISLSASTLTLSPKSRDSITVNVAALGSSSSVTLSVSGLPSKVNSNLSPSTVTTTDSSTLTLHANPRVDTGTYEIEVIGTNGAYIHSAKFTLEIQ